MGGYDWKAGKSYRAVLAEAEGKLVAGKFAAWVRRFKRYRGCTAADVRAGLSAAEWHHTSKFYNKVNYYDPMDLAELDNRQALRLAIRGRRFLAWMLRRFGKDGVYMLTTNEGEPWHAVDMSGKHSLHYLVRVAHHVATNRTPGWERIGSNPDGSSVFACDAAEAQIKQMLLASLPFAEIMRRLARPSGSPVQALR